MSSFYTIDKSIHPNVIDVYRSPLGALRLTFKINDIYMKPIIYPDKTNCGLAKIINLYTQQDLHGTRNMKKITNIKKTEIIYQFSKILDKMSSSAYCPNFEMSVNSPQWKELWNGLEGLDEYMVTNNLSLKGSWHVVEGKSNDRSEKNKFMLYTRN